MPWCVPGPPATSLTGQKDRAKPTTAALVVWRQPAGLAFMGANYLLNRGLWKDRPSEGSVRHGLPAVPPAG
jgi:hypothetical protein